ncbi:poly(3-hydroxybutyrate) depolymerase-like isoform X1 [Ptychodera flava]|uniref:poly(3-hydroxybutyrate) depolymerase-like isoform X1 n=2 Tax=Ptychodera flava TaxID=63121 RepID=UPI00396A6FBE
MATAIWLVSTLLSLATVGQCVLWVPDPDPDPLLGYGADPSQISVSGIGSGGYMAVQVQVAYSNSIMGCGTLAAGPYHCAEGSTLRALGACSDSPQDIDVIRLIDFTYSAEGSGDIDPVTGIADDKVYLFSGTSDTTVVPGVVLELESYYKEFINPTQIMTEYGTNANFAMITEHYGNGCTTSRRPYINNCNYPAAFHLMNHIYGGNLQRPSYTAAPGGDLLSFDQTELEPSVIGGTSLDSVGYIYVPTGCAHKPGCKLHIVFHGCSQGRNTLEEEFVLNSGYNEVGELNDIIIVYPQATSSAGNTNGCFDWWGYTNNSYDLKSGVQMQFVKNIIDRVTSDMEVCAVMENMFSRYQCVPAPPDPTVLLPSTTCPPVY